MMGVKLYNRSHPLLDFVLLDGLGRAGKFLLAKIVSNFQRVEYFEYVEVLETIPILNHLGCIESQAAGAYMQTIVDTAIYNRALGRNLNMREDDGSYIGNATNFNIYIDRFKQPPAPKAIVDMQNQKRLPSYLVHECLPHIDFLLKTFPKLLMINIQRHPVDIIHSWHMKRLGERYGNDHLLLRPVVDKGTYQVPWYANEWGQQYDEMNFVDRVIKSILSLNKKDTDAYNRLTPENERNILMISYEKLFSAPLKVVSKISSFINSDPFPNMEQLLKREGCPQDISIKDRLRKFEELRDGSRYPNLIEELDLASRTYETTWNLPPFL